MQSDCRNTDSSDDEQAYGRALRVKSSTFVVRPNSSPGYWLSCLLPLALATRYTQNTQNFASNTQICAPSITYDTLTIAAVGMSVETFCFFMYINMDKFLVVKLIISLIPGTLSTIMYTFLLQMSWPYGLLSGFSITFIYQNVYIRIIRGLPRCFTFGEAAVLVQGLMLFVLNAILQLYIGIFVKPVVGQFESLNAIMIYALFSLLGVCWLLATFNWLRKPMMFYALLVLLLSAVTCIPITQNLPIVTLLNFIIEDKTRVYIIFFYIVLVVLTICTIWWQLQNQKKRKASTRIRKIFHLLVVLVYVPGLLYQCDLLYIASGVAMAILTVLELFRLLETPPLAQILRDAFASFSDEKDAGALALTPFCLLIGCSLPIWISPNPCCSDISNRSRGTLLPLLSGVLAIGFGDTAASVIGSKYGRFKWHSSHRTIEGTVAFVLSIITAVLCLDLIGFIQMTQISWLNVLAATLVTALIEAHTDQIDNLVLPLIFYTIVGFC